MDGEHDERLERFTDAYVAAVMAKYGIGGLFTDPLIASAVRDARKIYRTMKEQEKVEPAPDSRGEG